jgi:hypothetical protein
MAQRYFITAESTYETLRQGLNSTLNYPNDLGKSIFQTALQAPRDSFRRVLLAVDTDLSGYTTVASAIAPLLDSDAMEELDEATYLAAVASATSGGGSASIPGASSGQIVVTTTGGALTTAATIDVTKVTAYAGTPNEFTPLADEQVLAFLSRATDDGVSSAIQEYYSYTLPTASSTVTGGVRIGSGVSIAANGVISVSTAYAATSHSHSAADVTSGTLDAARLTFATAAQAQGWRDTTAVVNAARSLDVRLSVLDYPTMGGNTYSGSGGSTTSVDVWRQCQSGATANGFAGVSPNLGGTGWPVSTGVTAGRINWAKPMLIVARCYRNAGNSTNHIMRVAIGDGVTNSFGAPTTRYIGVEARNNRYWLVGHNGTSAFAVDSSTDTTSGTPDTLALLSDGSGNAYLTVNGTQVATSASAPSSGAASNAMFKYEVGNGGDTSSNQWIFSYFRVGFA